MNFLQLKTRLAHRRGAKTSTLDSNTSTRYGFALNESHKKVLRKRGRESLRYGVVPFASVSGQKLYALPEHGVARINRIYETDNDRKLTYKTPDWLDTVEPDQHSGTPWVWVPRGLGEVHTQPSNASAMFADSTSASDTGTAYVEGIRTGGYFGSASVTMTGTTAVQVGSVTDFILITKFYLSTAAVGTVTLHEDSSGGTELSRIAVGDVKARFHQFQLFDTPSGVITYYADVLLSIPEMSNDTDEPWIPEDFHDMLIDMAELKELRKADDPNRFAMLTADVTTADRELDTFINNHPDWKPSSTDKPVGISTLGAWTPADTWVRTG